MAKKDVNRLKIMLAVTKRSNKWLAEMNRERYITSLVAAGYLQMTNPENPTASNQKYKKVTTK